jgi:hypothetical protein
MAISLKLGLNTVLIIHNGGRNTAGVRSQESGVRSQEEELEGGKNSLKSEKVIGK